MIWGEVINAVRNLHVQLLEQCQVPLTKFYQPCEFKTELPFPSTGEHYDDWNTYELPDRVQEALENHAIDRALLEGPLLPIQEVVLRPADWDHLLEAIVGMEKEWLQQASHYNERTLIFVEAFLSAEFLKLKTKTGAFKLRAV